MAVSCDEFGTRVSLADQEETPEFRAVWVEEVEKMLYNNQSENENAAKASPIPRVARPLLNAKPEVYIPQVVSLGPYHHWRLERHVDHHWRLKMSTAEAWKVMSAATFSSVISLAEVVKKIEMMGAEIASFYDWEIPTADYSKNFALMMAVDSAFLLKFLFGLLRIKLKAGSNSDLELNGRSSSTDMIDLSQLQVPINCDILKLENQIPLFVLTEVFKILITVQPSVLMQVQKNGRKLEEAFDNLDPGQLSGEEQLRFRTLLWAAYSEMSPFHHSVAAFGDNMDVALKIKAAHLLGYIHTIVSSFLKTGSEDELEHSLPERISSWLDENVVVKLCGIFFCFKKGKLPIDGYTAGQLARAGVKFKSFSHNARSIQFDKCTDTLYLPQLNIKSTRQTEAFFRNLAAYEFNDSHDLGSSVIDYVGLMDCLIDTPDDVRVLMDSHIIRRRSLMLTPERIANMWDGMCQPFSTGHSKPPRKINEAIREAVRKKHYKVRIRMWRIESWVYYYGKYFSSPWKFVALLFGIFLLAVNCISAYCTLFECNADNQGLRDQILLKTF